MNGYLLVCPVAYLLAGSLKFLVNSARARALAFGRIGLGGFPSTHTAIVSSAAWLIGWRQGVDTPAFCVALALIMVVVIDAMDLRRKLEKIHAVLKQQFPEAPAAQALRERVGHSVIEVLGGLGCGLAAAALMQVLNP